MAYEVYCKDCGKYFKSEDVDELKGAAAKHSRETHGHQRFDVAEFDSRVSRTSGVAIEEEPAVQVHEPSTAGDRHA